MPLAVRQPWASALGGCFPSWGLPSAIQGSHHHDRGDGDALPVPEGADLELEDSVRVAAAQMPTELDPGELEARHVADVATHLELLDLEEPVGRKPDTDLPQADAQRRLHPRPKGTTTELERCQGA